MNKFKIGDTIYIARYDKNETWAMCPDCFGSGQLTVVMGDESKVSIACECCKHGWEGSKGKIKIYECQPRAEKTTVSSLDIKVTAQGEIVEYHFNQHNCGYSVVSEEKVFATEAEALEYAKGLKADADSEEAVRLHRKLKTEKKWAWHVSYYRKMLRDAKNQIESATASLEVAKIEAKAEKAKGT